MSNSVTVVSVLFGNPQTGEKCAFTIPGAEGLETLSLMLSGKMEWSDGIKQMLNYLPNDMPPEAIDFFTESMALSYKCVDVISKVGGI